MDDLNFKQYEVIADVDGETYPIRWIWARSSEQAVAIAPREIIQRWKNLNRFKPTYIWILTVENFS